MAPGERKSEIEALPESPIAFRACSNGEFCPSPETERDRRAEEAWRAIVEEKHKRLGMTRRQFGESACGLAASLLVINQFYGCGSPRASGPDGGAGRQGGSAGTGGSSGGAGTGAAGTGNADAGYDVTADMTEDQAKA